MHGNVGVALGKVRMNVLVIQGVSEETFFQNFSAEHIKTLIWAILGILAHSGRSFLLILSILGISGHFGQFWANLGIFGNF